MFTVLIAQKEHIDAIQQENRLFFEPFLESKELAFCYWNPEGQSLIDSVPGLSDIVGRQKKWRAVIINPCDSEHLKARNPFDIVDFSSLEALSVPDQQPKSEELWKQWEEEWKAYYEALTIEKEKVFKNALNFPLQKLTTWLCYRPEGFILNEVKEKQDIRDWVMKKIGNDDLKPSARLELMEREQYKCELRMKEVIRKEFIAQEQLNIAYPTEVNCISLRTAESNFFDPDSYWNVRSENEYSTFADRNMYFDKMRFMVFDLLPRTHRDFRTDYIRFLASVLIFASNELPGSAMQARRLYQLITETDDTPLCTLITSYDKKLLATQEVIESEMEKIRSEIPGNLTDKEVETLLATPKDVAVVLDESCNTDKILAETDYGFFYDSPENEFHKWNRSFDTSKNTLSYIVKQQTRAIRKSVGQAKLSSEIHDIDVSRLTPFQIDDIREYTNALENEMVDSIPPDLTDISKYTRSLEKQSEEIKKVTRRRMTKTTTIVLASIFLALFLLCFLPFVFSNGSTPKTGTTAIVFIAIMLGLVLVVMGVALFFLRTTIKNAVKTYNDIAQGIINDMLLSMKRFSKYLSASCNVRRGHAIQNFSTKDVDDYTKSLRIRQKHIEDIRKKRAHLLEEYHDYLGDKSFCDETMARPYEYDFGLRKEYDYSAPFLAGDTRQIEFINSGNFVTVPSSFIKQISVKMEGIYEQ